MRRAVLGYKVHQVSEPAKKKLVVWQLVKLHSSDSMWKSKNRSSEVWDLSWLIRSDPHGQTIGLYQARRDTYKVTQAYMYDARPVRETPSNWHLSNSWHWFSGQYSSRLRGGVISTSILGSYSRGQKSPKGDLLPEKNVSHICSFWH